MEHIVVHEQVVVQIVEQQSIVVHEQVVVVRHQLDIMQILHVVRRLVLINQRTLIIQVMQVVIAVVGSVIHSICQNEILVKSQSVGNGISSLIVELM